MRVRPLLACALAALSLVAAGCSEEEADKSSAALQKEAEQSTAEESEAPAGAGTPKTTGEPGEKPTIAVPEGGSPPTELEVEDVTEGKGPAAKAGSQLSVNYVGVAYSTGEEFDTSFGRGPFEFELGGGMVIPGWDQGLEGMKAGGRRQLTIPAELAYGAQGSPPAIGPNEALVFAIDLLSIK